jgi:sugar phosphate isomerase/epimerase
MEVLMRLGGGIERSYSNPEEWIALVRELGYTTVLSPIDYRASSQERKDYLKCIQDNQLILGEVGAWGNPISKDQDVRKKALEYCKNQLALADDMNANCCVNIVGSRGDAWDAAHEDNYHEDTYALIIDSIRDIIDSVEPVRTYYTIEPMPWMIPDSPDQCLKLIKDVDRKAFAVHLDYANMINNPMKYLHSSKFIKECFALLGPYIKSVHAKDLIMSDKLPCVIEEVMPGKGSIDFSLVVRLCNELGSDTTVFVEHLNTFEEYKQASDYVRKIMDSELGKQ